MLLVPEEAISFRYFFKQHNAVTLLITVDVKDFFVIYFSYNVFVTSKIKHKVKASVIYLDTLKISKSICAFLCYMVKVSVQFTNEENDNFFW